MSETPPPEPRRLAFVACSYDTDHEPLRDQLAARLDQLARAFPARRYAWSLWVIDDLPPSRGFGERLRRVASELDLPAHASLHVVSLEGSQTSPAGCKGRALSEGFRRALEVEAAEAPEALVYLNLNLKVDAREAALGVEAVLTGATEVAIGTRAPREGGQAIGRGVAGELKSRGFNALTRALLPQLRSYRDTNAPLKVLSRRAAELVVREARLAHVTLDCEWLLLFATHGLGVQTYPLTWRQRAGSRVPWHLTGQSLLDLIHLRRRFPGRS